MWKQYLFFKIFILSLFHIKVLAQSDMQTIYTTESFYTPYWFNRTVINGLEQPNYDLIEVMASLSGYPDLPRWMNYYRRTGSPVGFFYGTPQIEDDGDIDIEIVLIDKLTYNTTKDLLKYRIHSREETFTHETQIKLFDLDLQDFIEKNVSSQVLEIIRDKLWRNNSLYITKMARPIDIGGRFPLDPREKEGVIVRIGSTANFTSELLTLEGEVSQIRSHIPCPKRFKATSAEYMFRENGLWVDWCRFEIRTPDGAIFQTQSKKTT